MINSKTIEEVQKSWDNRGWVQGAMYRWHGPASSENTDLKTYAKTVSHCCLWGALLLAADYEGRISHTQYLVLRSYLMEKLDTGLVDFNDKPGRTFEEVKAFLDKVKLEIDGEPDQQMIRHIVADYELIP